ncbi:cellulase [Colletotrichum graminicola M1.001]|uniref:Endoglucanase EG-II n=1 Tax=Colletotrichum graminicola (strain M1.001 / M2 / FGSC 10212) TaxID=645133 RepID=E3Q7Y2_COLGM|nr:cellulase [Colletotrichum graminicola M1.001]EFQ26994.1 cellulase [Colletotrichum graminicola M1.001]
MVSKTATLLGFVAAVVARGVAISGGDFGCEIDGSCPLGKVQLPLSSLGGGDGEGQMKHFVQDDKLNMFRLPIGWQFLVNNQLGGQLNSNNFGRYDQVMQKCLATGAYCMLDIHNFARWNGGIIGQGGPTDDQFVSLWTQLAQKYESNEKVVFELMNEPHDLDINLWAATCQKVVTAIRQAGATTQMILLPGTNFDSAAQLVSSGSAEALAAIKNPDGTTDGLIIDIHKYLDEDNSGTHKPCTTDNVDSFRTVAEFLRSKGRKGLVSETGASSDASCFTSFCAQNTFINQNSDVFIGLVAWAAGSFDTNYILSLTPKKSGNSYTDNQLMKQCVLDTWANTEQNVTAPATTAPQPVASGTKFGAESSAEPTVESGSGSGAHRGS